MCGRLFRLKSACWRLPDRSAPNPACASGNFLDFCTTGAMKTWFGIRARWVAPYAVNARESEQLSTFSQNNTCVSIRLLVTTKECQRTTARPNILIFVMSVRPYFQPGWRHHRALWEARLFLNVSCAWNSYVPLKISISRSVLFLFIV